MNYNIIGDSCSDLTDELRKDPRFRTVPLTLQVDDELVTDDETFDQIRFLKMVKNSQSCPKTACPSPEMYKEAYGSGAECVFVVTLSGHLSGSYNSAVLAKQLYEEEHGAAKVLVIDSLSASAGQLKLILHLKELCEMGLDFDEVGRRILELRDQMRTYFVLESLETLRKNGRLTGLQAFFATALNIKPVMGADRGTIVKLDQARGINKALGRMGEIAVRTAGATEDEILVISHCNNPERAEYVKQEMCARARFRQVVITRAAGVATVYAGDGGIVMAL